MIDEQSEMWHGKIFQYSLFFIGAVKSNQPDKVDVTQRWQVYYLNALLVIVDERNLRTENVVLAQWCTPQSGTVNIC